MALNPFLKKFLSVSRRSTRSTLREATAAIQRALAAQAQGTRPVTARRTAARPAGRPAGARSAAPPASPWAAADTTDRSSVAQSPVGPEAGRFVESSFTAATGTRLYKLFEPHGFAGPRPLLVMLHGCTQDPDDFAAGTRMNELAAEHGFYVLYPAQPPRSNASKCWNWFVPADQRRGQGEPALLAAMTRHIAQSQPIDRDRIYAAGLSAGGAMAAILGRAYPDLFAAIGVHSGLPPGAAHDVGSAFSAMKSGSLGAPPAVWPSPIVARAAGGTPLRTPLAAWPDSSPLPMAAVPVAADATEVAPGAPVIVFHGDADTTVHPVNGSHVIDAVIGAAAWQPSQQKVAASAGRRAYTQTVYRPQGTEPDSLSLAESWVVHGAGHAWSGGSPSGSYADASGPDASAEMLRFFLAHPHRSGD